MLSEFTPSRRTRPELRTSEGGAVPDLFPFLSFPFLFLSFGISGRSIAAAAKPASNPFLAAHRPRLLIRPRSSFKQHLARHPTNCIGNFPATLAVDFVRSSKLVPSDAACWNFQQFRKPQSGSLCRRDRIPDPCIGRAVKKGFLRPFAALAAKLLRRQLTTSENRRLRRLELAFLERFLQTYR